MKPHLSFDFKVNKEERTIAVNREFDADTKLVWAAWTTVELLDQWWGPRPWRAETKKMDFREGGHWLYAMIGPEGEKHWSKAEYIKIMDQEFFTAKDGFCDENGVMNPDFPQNLWENRFSLQQGKTLVSVLLTFDTMDDLEKTIRMGFQEGFTMGLNQLDELLEQIKQR